MEEIELNYVSCSTGELIVVNAEFDYVTGCNCDAGESNDHTHVTQVLINKTVDEVGNNVLLDRWEEDEIALELTDRIEEILDCEDLEVAV